MAEIELTPTLVSDGIEMSRMTDVVWSSRRACDAKHDLLKKTTKRTEKPQQFSTQNTRFSAFLRGFHVHFGENTAWVRSLTYTASLMHCRRLRRVLRRLRNVYPTSRLQ